VFSVLTSLLGEEHGIWAWERFNTLFNWMPLAAVIEKRVICMHGEVSYFISSLILTLLKVASASRLRALSSWRRSCVR